MILLTRLDASRVLVNEETIKYLEQTPDTLITFLNGDSLFVKESFEEVERSVVAYKRKVLEPFFPTPVSTNSSC
jgi:flagellar protein FlbD